MCSLVVLTMFCAVFFLLFCFVSTSDEIESYCHSPGHQSPIKSMPLHNYNVSNQIIDTVRKNYDRFCYQKIWKSLHSSYDTHQTVPKEVLDLINNLFPLIAFQPFGFTNRNAFKIFRSFLTNIPIKRYENPDWILWEWNPFKDNITGLAAYKHADGIHEIVQIYNNQMENEIKMSNLEVAGYVPKEFLRKLSENKSFDELQNVTIRMVLILNAKKFKGIWDFEEDIDHIIGVSIPGEYKEDHLPFLKGYFKYSNDSEANWVEFGSRYIDYTKKYLKETYLLSQMVFVGQINKTKLYDSVEESYCVTSNTGVLTPIYESVSDIKRCFFNDMCFNQFRLGYEDCNKRNGEYVCENNVCQDDNNGAYLNRTKLFYEKLLLCGYTENISYCNKTLYYMIAEAANYYDFTLIFYQFNRISNLLEFSIPPTDFRKLLPKGLSLLENDTELPQITALSTLIINTFSRAPSYEIYRNSRMISLGLNSRSDVIGFVDYGLNNISLITKENKTLNHSSDPNAKIVAYLEGFEDKRFTNFCNLYVFRGNFVENKNQTAKSDVLAVYCPNIGQSVLKVYLRVRNFDGDYRKATYSNEGYSLDIHLKREIVSLVYIPNGTVCSSMSTIGIFERSNSYYGNMTYADEDVLSCNSAASMKTKTLFSLVPSLILLVSSLIFI